MGFSGCNPEAVFSLDLCSPREILVFLPVGYTLGCSDLLAINSKEFAARALAGSSSCSLCIVRLSISEKTLSILFKQVAEEGEESRSLKQLVAFSSSAPV